MALLSANDPRRFPGAPSVDAEGRLFLEREFPGLLQCRERLFSFWTPDEDEHLLDLVAQELTVAEIAALHGRVPYEVLFRLVEEQRLLSGFEVDLVRVRESLHDLAGAVADPIRCELHGEPLRFGTAVLVHGLIDEDVLDPAAEAALCPRAESTRYRGCVVEPEAPARQLVLRCERCQEVREAWPESGRGEPAPRAKVPVRDVIREAIAGSPFPLPELARRAGVGIGRLRAFCENDGELTLDEVEALREDLGLVVTWRRFDERLGDRRC